MFSSEANFNADALVPILLVVSQPEKELLEAGYSCVSNKRLQRLIDFSNPLVIKTLTLIWHGRVNGKKKREAKSTHNTI